jgi:hypothetical protein
MSVDQDLIKKSEDVIKRIEQYVSDQKVDVIAQTDVKIQEEKNAAITAAKKSL